MNYYTAFSAKGKSEEEFFTFLQQILLLNRYTGRREGADIDSKTDRMEWERLISANENRLYRAALAILGSTAEAEDAVQDAFLKYLEKRPKLQDPEDVTKWLMRVTVNGCKDRLRSAYRRSSVPLADDFPCPGPEERQELEELAVLSPRDRTLIHLYYYEGYTTAEIAGMTGQREGTVRSRLSRARAQLRSLLQEKE